MSPFSALCLGILLAGARPETSTPATPDETAVKSLADEFSELIPALIEALDDSDQDVRNNASQSLVALGPEALPALLEAIDGARVNVRVEAVRIVGHMASGEYVPRAAIPVLLKVLKDENTQVRQAAGYAIEQLVTNSAARQRQARIGGLF